MPATTMERRTRRMPSPEIQARRKQDQKTSQGTQETFPNHNPKKQAPKEARQRIGKEEITIKDQARGWKRERQPWWHHIMAGCLAL